MAQLLVSISDFHELLCDIPTQRVQAGAALSDRIHQIMNKWKDCSAPSDQKRLMKRIRFYVSELTACLLPENTLESMGDLAHGTHLVVAGELADMKTPWELLQLKGEFLCMQFGLSRELQTSASSAVEQLDVDSKDAASISTDSKQFDKPSWVVLVSEAWELPSTTSEKTIVERRLRRLEPSRQSWVGQSRARFGTHLSSQLSKSHFLHGLEDARWFHFAGHGVERKDTAEQGLLLRSMQGKELPEQEEVIFPADLSALKRSPQYVFLNACNALSLPEGCSEPEASLVGQLQCRGSQAVLGAVAPVIDADTRHFTMPLYDAISSGKCIGDAMSIARRTAMQELGEDNLLPLSYVHYGEPTMTLLQGNDSVGSKRPHRQENDLKSLTHRHPSDSLALPYPCGECGVLIETIHGVANRFVANQGHAPLCRKCYREGTPSKAVGGTASEQTRPASTPILDKPAYLSPEQACASAAFAATPVPTSLATSTPVSHPAIQDAARQHPLFKQAEQPPEPEAVRAFREFLGECIQRPLLTFSPSGDVVPLQLIAKSKGREGERSLAELDAPMAVEQRSSQSDYFELQCPLGESAGQVALISHWTEDEKKLNQASFLALLDEHLPKSPPAKGSYCIVICSMFGFAEELLQGIASEVTPQWYPRAATVVLHDVALKTTAIRKLDEHAYPWMHFFDRNPQAKQFETASEWLEQQMPLATSLCSQEVSQTLALEVPAVELAFRYAATRFNLKLDQEDRLGLIVSNADASSRPEPRLPTQRSNALTWWQRCIRWWKSLLSKTTASSRLH